MSVVVNPQVVILFDENEVAMAVEDGTAIPVGTRAVLFAGTDGTDAIIPKVTAARRLVVDGSEVTQPISAVALPLPTGAATEATLMAVEADVSNLDVLLSSRASEATAAAIAAIVFASLDTTLSSRASEATLAAAAASLVSIDTDFDVLLSTRASEATLSTRASEATLSTRASEATLSTRASEATLALIKAKTDNLDVLLSTRASEATLLTRLSKADFEARINTLGQKAMAASTPVVIASDQSDVGVKQPTASLLNATVQGPAADGAAPVGNPVLAAGSDGVNVQTLLTDTGGRQVVIGQAATGAPIGGIVNVQGVDIVTTAAALGALNAAATITINGQSGAGFQLAAGTLIGTIVAEASYDAGTTWNQIPFWNQTTQAFLNNLVFGAANTATALALLVPPGASSTRVRVSAYTSGTANATVRGSSAASPVRIVSSIDGCKATYSATVTGLVFAASATDIFTITGSASKVARVLRVAMSATQTSGARRDVRLLKRSTANSGGTSTAREAVPHDSADPPATATVLAYTANPTTGTLIGVMRGRRPFIDSANPSGAASDDVIWDLGNSNDKSGVLRGTGEVLAVNMNGVTSTGNLCALYVMWTEE